MTEPPPGTAPQRVAPFALPEGYALPPKPGGDAESGVTDAHRQAGFVLGADVRLLERGMSLQVAVLRDSYGGPFRTHQFAAIAMLWSRAFACERDAIALAFDGAYVSAIPLLRGAAEALAGECGLLREDDVAAFEAWLAGVGQPDEALKAIRVPIGFYRTGSVLASDELLGPLYRVTSDLGNTHFGASLLEVAPESNQQKLAVAFGERLFHLAWAELTFGWALTLAVRQLRFAIEAAAPGIVAMTAERRAECEAFDADATAALARRDRCAISEVEVDGGRRLLVANFRRAPGSAARRVVM